MRINPNKGFTLVEILCVVAIIALILAIAIPTFITIRINSQKTICIANLDKISGAIDQWALERQIPAGTAISGVDEDDIYNNFTQGGKKECPAGGAYTLHTVGETPQVSCSLESEGHKLAN
ncbi:MAG: prepilin-type N-terminal cleavage/methylation domain-containing protein [Candidatus Omnitrophota bacterium]|nr:prepilin-type N-terminal cleavage/methylation domain-containing protein [Candidatus Omnitrophota bacterium]